MHFCGKSMLWRHGRRGKERVKCELFAVFRHGLGGILIGGCGQPQGGDRGPKPIGRPPRPLPRRLRPRANRPAPAACQGVGAVHPATGNDDSRGLPRTSMTDSLASCSGKSQRAGASPITPTELRFHESDRHGAVALTATGAGTVDGRGRLSGRGRVLAKPARAAEPGDGRATPGWSSTATATAGSCRSSAARRGRARRSRCGLSCFCSRPASARDLRAARPAAARPAAGGQPGPFRAGDARRGRARREAAGAAGLPRRLGADQQRRARSAASPRSTSKAGEVLALSDAGWRIRFPLPPTAEPGPGRRSR